MKKIAAGSFVILIGIVLSLLLVRPQQNVEFVIAHTNDHHGYCWSRKDKGGFAKQSTLLKNIRTEFKNVLLLSGGDINTGAPEADLNQGKPSFIGMNFLKFDAMALGNHEFDNSLEYLKQQAQWADFPFLASNVFEAASGERLFQPYFIMKMSGVRVAIIGAVTEDSAFISNVKTTDQLRFTSAVAEIAKVYESIKNKADLFIAVTHMGFNPSEMTLSDPYTGKGEIALARAVPALHVIVGGHSHTLLKEPFQVSQTLILQAKHYAEYLGELHLQWSNKNKKVESWRYTSHPLDEKIQEDEEMLAVLKPYKDKVEVLLKEPVGETLVELSSANVRENEASLGNLVTDIYQEVTGADVALQNGGGIRSSIEKGAITYGDILRTFPFGNTIAVFELKGRDLKKILERSAGLHRPSGAFLQVSGLTLKIRGPQLLSVLFNNKPLEMEKLYKVATNSFIANGGDGYEDFKKFSYRDTGYVDAAVIKKYIEGYSPIHPKIEKRIQIL
ncbi:MAG: 5'-nucleotidase C-terminal domain-containing protein [Deltaproteobacteria bacterium]|nr:5'-nucleotidase C-terminal domain-containing protein [Deltaproteobacteria bacterium]